MRFIVNQDRDEIYQFTGEELFYTAPAMFEDKLMGINLMMSSHCLGTFDSLDKAIQEINYIHNSRDEIIKVGGFSDYTVWD